MFQARGKLRYDPTAGKAKNAWWLILECPKDILDYYVFWVQKETGVKLNKPLFGSHISVIRGEEPPLTNQQFWQKYQEVDIEFSYSHEVETDGEFYWLPVTCEALSAIRKELGLSYMVSFGFHLTIGRKIQN